MKIKFILIIFLIGFLSAQRWNRYPPNSHQCRYNNFGVRGKRSYPQNRHPYRRPPNRYNVQRRPPLYSRYQSHLQKDVKIPIPIIEHPKEIQYRNRSNEHMVIIRV